MIIKFPPVYSLNLLNADNSIRQVGALSYQAEGTLRPFTFGRREEGHLFESNAEAHAVLIVRRLKSLPETCERILQAEIDPQLDSVDFSGASWLKHPLLNADNGRLDGQTRAEEVLNSWQNAFNYLEESRSTGTIGLRPPQLGALHSIRAHWFLDNSTATIVLPTGTGKTETMLASLVSVPCSKVLVIVPTDALRGQIAEKFSTLGILKMAGSKVLSESTKFPVVCILRHIPTLETVENICAVSNVIVTTSSIAGQCSPEVQTRLATLCPYLFIDEAHHAEAPTWKQFKETFAGKRILQFTATPFREDDEPLDGKIIFKYPLRKAQEEEYFRPIRFVPVIEFDRRRADVAISQRAIEQLRADAAKGHILMARVDSVARAREVFAIYEQYAEFNPVQLHTGIKSVTKRQDIRRQLLSGHSKIVVCVDMLGEGFDLPELKIAAFHDIRKSLAITLQLAGRFTRNRPDLGDATFIANTADVNVRHELRKLYSRDPDWNILLPQLSDQLISEQVSLQEFLRGFTPLVQQIPVRSIKPATSTVVYKTTCRAWTPENFKNGIPAIDSCAQVHEAINHSKHTLVIVTARQVGLDWTDVSNIFGWQWELYVVMWSPEQNLLFINSSTNSGEYKTLAQAVTNDESALIRGHDVFRSFAGVNRLRLQNIGLTEQLGRNVRYIGRMGADVASALTDAQRRHARKAVYAGSGYENGEKSTVGASRKGRIWSHQRGSVEDLLKWCHRLGAKLLDTTINPDELLQDTLEPHVVSERPAKMPIMAAWPEIFYREFETPWKIVIDGQSHLVDELNIDVSNAAPTGALRLSISSDIDEAIFQLEFFQEGENPNFRFASLGNRTIQLKRSDRSEPESLASFFYENPPVIWFVDGSSLEGNDFVELRHQAPPYNVDNIDAYNWQDTDIENEIQGPAKTPDSIQAKVIRELIPHNYDIIMDDHGKGEAADIVTIRVIGDNRNNPSQIDVEFYHCKKSGGPQSGARVGDLYEVCGQAQKSILWMFSQGKTTDLFTHLLRREGDRRHANGPSRFEVGTHDLLVTLREMSQTRKVSLKVFIVQPGLSKNQASREQLELLSVTESYLKETYQLDFGVVASE